MHLLDGSGLLRGLDFTREFTLLVLGRLLQFLVTGIAGEIGGGVIMGLDEQTGAQHKVTRWFQS